ncbi:PREDICTED: uncharacterized protein LOC109190603 isoform X2 [Ipomoea nil]|uniref:uncharacterized protein LOC109190603 isoform X2 n=1 Tax=Ipomoea nil TaxID=35883 RepID=UPI0009012DF3|nr:PREDICTED: uncharacterized protein LOC109190603 isoform X2 [Ipomoea nil]
MISRRNCARLFSIAVTSRTFCHHHPRRRGICGGGSLMAAASSPPFASHPKLGFRCFPGGRSSLDVCGRGRYGNGSAALVLRDCCSGNASNAAGKWPIDGNFYSASSSSINGNNNGLPKPRAVSPCLPHLLRDSEEFRLGDEASSFSDTNSKASLRGGSSLEFSNHYLPEKIEVAVDVDEVLGNFVSALNRFIADRYSSHHSVSEYHVYEFFKIWNCSRDEADIRVHEFFKTCYFKKGIHPIPGAKQALQNLSRFCNLSIVTSRQNAIKDHTVKWIENHYPGLFQNIHFGNHFALNGKSIPKSEICRSLGAKVLIDDNPRYAIECAEVGMKVLLFDYENSYPWCKTESVEGHPLVTKVHNWEEVEQQLVSWTFPKIIAK